MHNLIIPTTTDIETFLRTTNIQLLIAGERVPVDYESMVVVGSNFVGFCWPHHSKAIEYGSYFLINVRTGAVENLAWTLPELRGLLHAHEEKLAEAFGDRDPNKSLREELLDEEEENKNTLH